MISIWKPDWLGLNKRSNERKYLRFLCCLYFLCVDSTKLIFMVLRGRRRRRKLQFQVFKENSWKSLREMNGHCLFAASPPRLFPLRSISSSVSPSGSYRIKFSDNVAVECRNLCFSVSTRQGISVPILRDCSFRIPSGQLWMILGPNGCGKSTLLKVFLFSLKHCICRAKT